jgi:hypothetical protein
VIAVHQQRPGGLGPGENVERQQVDLGVPEHMPEVGIAGQRPGADRDSLVLRIGGPDQVVGGEPQRLLGFLVAFDADVAARPALRPCGFVRHEDAAPPGALCSI